MMNQDRRINAVRAFRRRSIGLDVDDLPRLRAVFVSCSECIAAATLLAELKPEQLLLTPGGVTGALREQASFGANRGNHAEPRHVVLVGHSRCTYPAWRARARGEEEQPREASEAARLHLWTEFKAFRALGTGGASVHALFLEEDDGDLFKLIEEPTPRFALVCDPDCQDFLQTLARVPQ